MNQHLMLAGLFSILSLLVYILVMVRVLLRPNRDPSSRVAWIVVILALPVMGMVAYILLGETNIGRKRVARIREVIAGLPDVNHLAGADAADLHGDVPLNYENNILFYDKALTADVLQRQKAISPNPNGSRPRASPPGAGGGDCGTTPSPCSAGVVMYTISTGFQGYRCLSIGDNHGKQTIIITRTT